MSCGRLVDDLHGCIEDEVVGAKVGAVELDALSMQFCQVVRRAGVPGGKPVLIACERGLGFAVALLGVWRADCVPVLADGSEPLWRLQAMAEQVGAAGVVIDPAHLTVAGPVAGEAVIRVTRSGSPSVAHGAADPRGVDLPADTAYVVFTSGTTAHPRAVAVGQSSLENHIRGFGAALALTADDRVLQFAQPGFDVCLEEVLPTLAAGATVVMPPWDRVPPLPTFVDVIRHAEVSVVNLPSSYFCAWSRMLAEPGLEPPAGLRAVVIGSEPARAADVVTWLRSVDSITLYHAYGCAETTITNSISWLRPEIIESIERNSNLPIGAPLPGVEFTMVPLPTAGSGPERHTLRIRGTCLALGYVGAENAVESARRLVPNPDGSFDTGDVCYLDHHAGLFVAGRIDDERKVAGRRVHPREVEAAILELDDSVLDVTVIPDRSGDHLIAFVVRSTEEPDTGSFAGLCSQLPRHLRPVRLHSVEELPRGGGSKVDRAALLEIDDAAQTRRHASTELEAAVLAAFREILDIDDVDAADDFFELGGDSLAAEELCTRLAPLLDVQLDPAVLLARPSAGGLVRHLRTCGDGP